MKKLKPILLAAAALGGLALIDVYKRQIQYRIENAGTDDQIPHGFQRPVDLLIIRVKLRPEHLVRSLPLIQFIILSLSACHKKSLLS